jgi:hypothetical protein
MHKILFTLFFVVAGLLPSGSSVAKPKARWHKMYPVKSCKKFHIKYSKHKKRYFVAVPKLDGTGEYMKPVFHLSDINDLSSLTDIISDKVQLVCPGPYAEEHDPATCNPVANLTPEYIHLLTYVTKVINKHGDKCENVTAYIELQDKIEAMPDKQLITMDNSSNIGHLFIKLFKGDETDELVDHFATCGGSDGSHRFIRNLILMEMRKQCIIPEPPGLFDWKEARLLASEVANKYKGISITSLNSKRKKIERDVLLNIARAATVKSVKSVFPDVDAEKYVDKLDAYQKLKKAKTGYLTDYLSKVYTIDATFEVADQMIPDVIKSNFEEKLPASWSKSKKDEFMRTNLVPKAKESYKKCIDPIKHKARYGEKGAPKIHLNYRKWMEKEYCKHWPDECRKTARNCEGGARINVLSGRPDVTNTDVVMGCAYDGILSTLYPLLGAIIRDQKDGFADSFDLTDEMAKDFTDRTWTEMRRCLNYESRQLTDQPLFTGRYDVNQMAATRIKSDVLTEKLIHCSNEAEKKVSQEFVTQLMINNPTLQESFADGPLTEQYGKQYRRETVVVASQIVRGNL